MSERLSRERLEEIRGWMSDDDLDNHGPDGFLFSGTQAVLMLDQCLQHIAALEAENERLREGCKEQIAECRIANEYGDDCRPHFDDGGVGERCHCYPCKALAALEVGE